jgi:uncharacterized membrane protein
MSMLDKLQALCEDVFPLVNTIARKVHTVVEEYGAALIVFITPLHLDCLSMYVCTSCWHASAHL